MKHSILLLALLLLLVPGCKQKKSQAQLEAERAQIEYERTLIRSAQERISIANKQLEAAGMMTLDTAMTGEMFRALHGKDLEETIASTLSTVER